MQTPAVIEELINTCKTALGAESPANAINTAMRDLFADPAALAAQVPHFSDEEIETSACGFRLGGEHVAHHDEHLTILVLDTLPGSIQPPHDHNMNVVIGVFEGAEKQRFWTRTDDGIAPTAGRVLEPGDVMALGARGIHAISAPVGQPARAIHVYLGDIFGAQRSVFNPETLVEYPMTDDRYDEFCQTDDA
ncbi:MAG: hypothetical protein GWP48_02330 [Actinobacteria bacterium]|nr:hypothetical protein [Actinomycetota bacterium]